MKRETDRNKWQMQRKTKKSAIDKKGKRVWSIVNTEIK